MESAETVDMRYSRKKLMAHAFGGMDGTTYHNTAEAFEHGKKGRLSVV